jgi:hypothetical protein
MTDKNGIVVTVQRPSQPWFSSEVQMDQLVQNARATYGTVASEDTVSVKMYDALGDVLPHTDSYPEDDPAQLLVLVIDDQSRQIFGMWERVTAFIETNCLVLVATTWMMGRSLSEEFLKRNEINRDKSLPGRISVILDENLTGLGNYRAAALEPVKEWQRNIGVPVL